MKLFFFDLETTGVNPGKNGIHQISGEIVIDGKTMERFDFKVQPNPCTRRIFDLVV
jgi:DNA polymerase-3 subunit epsilon